jgi:hypothetical protein
MEHSKNQHEQSQWEQLVESTFERPVPKVPVMRKKSLPKIPKWLPIGAVAVLVVIFAIGILLTLPNSEEQQPTLETPPEPRYEIPQELLVCKDALDQWQALDSYKITGTFTRYGSAVKVTTDWHEQYWVSGEDWVMFNSAYKQVISSSILPPAGYMYRDGEFYTSHSDTNPLWIHMKRESTDLEIWPMTFSWDTCEFVYLGTIQESNATMVRFAVIDRSQEATSVSNVEFMILRGKLQTVTVIQTQQNGTIAKDVYMLSSSDADVIEEYIATQVIRDPSGVEIVTPDIIFPDIDIEPTYLPND